MVRYGMLWFSYIVLYSTIRYDIDGYMLRYIWYDIVRFKLHRTVGYNTVYRVPRYGLYGTVWYDAVCNGEVLWCLAHKEHVNILICQFTNQVKMK